MPPHHVQLLTGDPLRRGVQQPPPPAPRVDGLVQSARSQGRVWATAVPGRAGRGFGARGPSLVHLACGPADVPHREQPREVPGLGESGGLGAGMDVDVVSLQCKESLTAGFFNTSGSWQLSWGA